VKILSKFSKELEVILSKATVYKKLKKGGKIAYLHVRVATGTSKKELAQLQKMLESHGFHPNIMKVGTKYYILQLSRKKEVKQTIESYIGIENLPPEHRKIYETWYKDPSLWGLRYNLTPILKDPEKKTTLYYLLGALTGDGYQFSQHRLALAVVDKPLAEKFAEKVKEIGLYPEKYVEKRPERTIYHVIVGSTHLIRLFNELKNNPQQLEELPEKHFWAYFEGLYETDGSLRLIDNRFEVRIRLRKPPGPKILEHLEKRLLKMGLSATRNPYKKGYAYVLRIKEMKSIIILFTNIDPIIKNPKTGTLSTKIIKHAKKRGINPQTISQQWRKRWQEYLQKYPDA